MTNTTVTIETAMEDLLEDIRADYLSYTSGHGTRALTDVNHKMIAEFNSGLSYTVGKKYIKVISGSSVWAFIVNTPDDKKFKNGDILKAASWNMPARNSARGNVLDGGYSIAWTGPHYLK